MAARPRDWFRQAERDLVTARHCLAVESYEWACFACQQAAKQAAQAVHQHLDLKAWGHAASALLEALPEEAAVTPDLIDAARELDRHYIPARYPNAYPQGAPYEFYARADAERAVHHAEQIIRHCAALLQLNGSQSC